MKENSEGNTIKSTAIAAVTRKSARSTGAVNSSHNRRNRMRMLNIPTL